MTAKHTAGTTAMTAADLLGDALCVGLNQIGRDQGCVPLLWSVEEDGAGSSVFDGRPVISGMVGAEHADAAVPEVLTAWATLLNLAADTTPCPGTAEYRGTVAGLLVQVWGVTDRDVFEHGLGARS
jgi:hypothetical protein